MSKKAKSNGIHRLREKGHGDAETRGRGDTETRGHGDTETRGQETLGQGDADLSHRPVAMVDSHTNELSENTVVRLVQLIRFFISHIIASPGEL